MMALRMIITRAKNTNNQTLVTHDTNEEAVRYYLAGRQPDPLKLLELWNRGKEVLEIGL